MCTRVMNKEVDFDSLTFTVKSLEQLFRLASIVTKDNLNMMPSQISNKMIRVLRDMYNDGRIKCVSTNKGVNNVHECRLQA